MFALVEGLPPTSRLHAHLQGGQRWRDFWGWGKDRHMAADFYDLYVAAHTPKGKKPYTYPRPTTVPEGATPFRALIGRDL